MAEEKIFYIGIPNPHEIRKYLLESSKSGIHLLRKYEDYKRTRVKKLRFMSQYIILMKQIELLNNRLNKEFPKVGIRIPTVRTEPRRRVIIEKGVDIKQLERELEMIEEKLDTLH